MTKVAIISDSHGALDRFGEALQNLSEGGVQQVIHAGDFLADGVEELLGKFPNLEFQIARGNCDVNEELIANIRQLPNIELEDILEFELSGKKFAAAHRVEDLREIQDMSSEASAKGDAEIYISGHTHIPQVKNVDGKLFLNPGSLMDDGGYFLLDLESLEVERKLFSEKI